MSFHTPSRYTSTSTLLSAAVLAGDVAVEGDEDEEAEGPEEGTPGSGGALPGAGRSDEDELNAVGG